MAAARLVDVFVLRLENGKYWVGGSQNLLRTLGGHLCHPLVGAWLQLNNPIEVISVFRRRPRSDVGDALLLMMGIFGIDNVRGVTCPNLNLTQRQMERVTRHSVQYVGCCYRCMANGHAGQDCPNPSPVPTMDEIKAAAPEPNSSDDENDDDSSLPEDPKLREAAKMIDSMKKNPSTITRDKMESLIKLVEGSMEKK